MALAPTLLVRVSAQSAWTLFVVLAVATRIPFYAAPSPAVQAILDVGVSFACAGAIVAGVVLQRPVRWVPWLLLALGILLFGVGDAIWSVYDLALGAEAPFPSIADLVYFLGYASILAGGLLLIRRKRRLMLVRLLEAGIVAAGFALPAWIWLMEQQLSVEGSTTLQQIVSIAYPAFDVGVIAVIAYVALTPRWRCPAFALFAVGAMLMLATDVVYYSGVLGYPSTGAWLFNGYFLFYVLWGAAVLHPSMRTLSLGVEESEDRLGRGALLVLAAASATAPATLAWQTASGRTIGLDDVLITAGLVVLVVLRLALLVGELTRAREEERQARAAAETAGAQAEAARGLLLEQNSQLHKLAEENGRLLETSRHEALTDALTGLGNRRKLMVDIEQVVAEATASRPALLAIFDLDGFKLYNDTFGHPAGDVLLARLGRSLEDAAAARSGAAYRMGGDEFCVLASLASDADLPAIVEEAADALSISGEAFEVDCSFGAVRVPAEATTREYALRVADERLYAQKSIRRGTQGGRETKEALTRLIAARNPELATHVSGVADLAEAVARHIGMTRDEALEVRLGAALHDVGKAAVPDTILSKPGPLDDAEWDFIHRHTLIGERIVAASPALAGVARLIRWSHERVDGKGYPDGLSAEKIPLGARIIAICDSFDAMISERPYRRAMSTDEALAELRRCAGTQFDPEVVDVFCEVIEDSRGWSRTAGRSGSPRPEGDPRPARPAYVPDTALPAPSSAS